MIKKTFEYVSKVFYYFTFPGLIKEVLSQYDYQFIAAFYRIRAF